jgi:hypothetical protein
VGRGAPVRRDALLTAAGSLILLAALANASDTSALPADIERRLFERQVAAFAQEAEQIDGLFAQFAVFCDVEVASRDEGARDWFALWDDAIHADVSGGICQELFDRIVAKGETVKKGMAAAEVEARACLDPDTIRAIQRRYFMDWDGWELPAPRYPPRERPDPEAPGLPGILRA